MVDSIREKGNIPIIHLPASEAVVLYPKPDFVNGCRLGKIMYGVTVAEDLDLKSTFKVCSEVVQINTLKKGETVGYNGAYTADVDDEKIAVVAIGYADGIIRKNTGRYVYINDKKYKIVRKYLHGYAFYKSR